MGERIWMLAQPVIAVLALAGSALAWYLQATAQFDYLPSLQAVITASFVFPGLALSMLVNHAIVVARRPGSLTAFEKLLVVAQVVIAVVLALTSLDPAALLLGFLLWPLLIVAAASACISMLGTTLRVRRERRQPHDGGDAPERASADPGTAELPLVSPAN